MSSIYNFFAGPAMTNEGPEPPLPPPAPTPSGSSGATGQSGWSSATSVGPPSSLRGRTYIVTGAASGIGRATAIHLASLGAHLALTDIDAELGSETCQLIQATGSKIDVVFATMDVTAWPDQNLPKTHSPPIARGGSETDHEAVVKLVRKFYGTFKRLDGLVNCVGVQLPSPLAHEAPADLMTKMLDINVKGAYSFCQAFIAPIMQQGEDWQAPIGGYSIVKHALLGFSRSLALEYAAYNIRTNVVAPGFVSTPSFHDHFSSDIVDQTEAEATASVPMKRIAEAREVAHVIAFLLSVESSYVTGAVIPVDGGASVQARI
ncbi:BZ3500_MvSof-1268-A1-R1_Chr11-1g03250 [Microbotryum saponariae]|uniref:BZ3500_MvSof-1268-A1-R1_Chr11-1g03250 protein n=1 Tax=Microbotryum saponariae TaxID=289078 RepID=A0A2X0LDQ5_9BASI|nr:BZ3501_MvSof-1269-A2-R1_Chr11g02825 [Microbotryum saponariae]SDA03813.1 BZ3500_MvSof-1268-A1-R1_Chr11-1g03250 [Microbotryum saponariae]